MGNKTYKDYFFTEEAYIKDKVKIDKKINEYENKFMSNAKWEKLFLTIYLNNDIIKNCEIIDFFSFTYRYIKNNVEDYKNYIHRDCIDNILITGEHSISYREIEYIEFKKKWLEEKIGTMEQDTNKIKEIISKTGKYEWEETENHIRIYGYKK